MEGDGQGDGRRRREMCKTSRSEVVKTGRRGERGKTADAGGRACVAMDRAAGRWIAKENEERYTLGDNTHNVGPTTTAIHCIVIEVASNDRFSRNDPLKVAHKFKRVSVSFSGSNTFFEKSAFSEPHYSRSDRSVNLNLR